MADTKKNPRASESPRSNAHDEISPRPGAAVAQESKVHTVQRVPGAPILWQDDAKNLELLAKERRDHVDPEVPLPVRDVPVHDPKTNGESRNNIVPDGPGTYGEVGLTVGPL